MDVKKVFIAREGDNFIFQEILKESDEEDLPIFEEDELLEDIHVPPISFVGKTVTYVYPVRSWVQAPTLKVKIKSTELEMEAAIVHLDHSIRNTENKLDLIHVQISEFENFTSETQLGVLEQISVLKLLQSVSEVKQEYEKIRKEVLEVQELQHQLANTLQSQVQLLQGRSKMLKEKILDRIQIEKS